MISLIIALYNEAGRFPAHLPAVKKFLDSLGEPWELLLVDDGSRDETPSLMLRWAAQDARLRPFYLRGNHGQGAAVKLGVLASHGDVVIYMDADLSVSLERARELIDQVRGACDVAVASRWMRGSSIRVPQPPLRRFLGRMYYRAIRWLLLPEVADCNCGLKAYRGDAARIIFGYVRTWRWAFNVEHLWLARRLGFSISEIPVDWRHDASSKVRVWHDVVFTLWELTLLHMRRLMGGYPVSRRA